MHFNFQEIFIINSVKVTKEVITTSLDPRRAGVQADCHAVWGRGLVGGRGAGRRVRAVLVGAP